MALITFTSDFGLTDHYTAAVKAVIRRHTPDTEIIDITHLIRPSDIAEAAVTIRSVYTEFPEGTVHLIAVGTDSNKPCLAAKINGHYFVGPDNGILSLTDERVPEVIVELFSNNYQGTFPEKNIMAKAAAELAKGTPINALGEIKEQLHDVLDRQLRITKNSITGHVIKIDRYGNLITNITAARFEEVRVDRNFEIRFGRETTGMLHRAYTEVEPGDCVAVFNDNNSLEIAVNRGHASKLLGMNYDSPVTVNFFPEK